MFTVFGPSTDMPESTVWYSATRRSTAVLRSLTPFSLAGLRNIEECSNQAEASTEYILPISNIIVVYCSIYGRSYH